MENTAAAARTQFPKLNGALPLVGHLFEMYRRFPRMCERGIAAHGPLFFIDGGPSSLQLVCTGARALQLLKLPELSTGLYAQDFNALLGNTLLAFDGDKHRQVRQLLTPPFTPQRIRRSDVLQIVSSAVGRRIASWRGKGEFGIVVEMREMALEIIFRIVGVPLDRLAVWRSQYERFLLAALPSRGKITGPITWLAARARAWLDQEVGEIVDELRRSGDTGSFIGGIANLKDESGALLDRSLVIANIRLLLFAGHETTASAMAWTALHFAATPSYQVRAMEEVSESGDLIELAMNSERFTFAEKLFREALRLYPAVHSVVRRVTESVALDVGIIPAGTMVNIPLVYLLRDPERFPRPERFDPDRWQERPRAGTVETAMFGGGPHFCLGYHIAIAEGTLFTLLLARMLRDHGLMLTQVKPRSVPEPVFLPLVHPPRNATLRLVPR